MKPLQTRATAYVASVGQIHGRPVIWVMFEPNHAKVAFPITYAQVDRYEELLRDGPVRMEIRVAPLKALPFYPSPPEKWVNRRR